jgi:CheY-like chemotaxis protein
MLSKIFEPFMQLNDSLERSRGGLGIGLTLVKQLVEMHGGAVEARSEGADQGAEFMVRLPIAVTAMKERGQPASEIATKAATGAGHHILVADDNEDAANSLSALLRIIGHDVRVAYDGAEAVELAATFRPDVILLDIGMPGLNGFEAARDIRARPWGKNVMLIAVTGYGQKADKRRSREVGFNHHIVKPINFTALEKLLAGVRFTTLRYSPESG